MAAVRRRFHKARQLPDVYLDTAEQADAFFTPALCEWHELQKIGYGIVKGTPYIMFFLYQGAYESGRDPCQKIEMGEDAMARAVEILGALNMQGAAKALYQVKEGLSMIRVFAPKDEPTPQVLVP